MFWLLGATLKLKKIFIKEKYYNGGLHSTEVAYLLLTQADSGLILSIPEIFTEEKLSMLLRLINGAGWRKVDSGLKI